MKRSFFLAALTLCTALFSVAPGVTKAGESIWIEAENLQGWKGYCWPMGKPEMQITKGNWALSGPGWAAEWNQGGESGFLSIATAGNDDHATVWTALDIPADGTYYVWVRYGDWREAQERFSISIEQPGAAAWRGNYGEKPVIEEDNEMKLYWGWAFGWDKREAKLKKGDAKLLMQTFTKDPNARQVDVIVLTTDPSYNPGIKERPITPARALLDSYRKGFPADMEPLARAKSSDALPAAWKIRTFHDKGFRYLWNVTDVQIANWLSDNPNRMKYPYNMGDADLAKAFEAKYGGKDDVPIFSDKRLVPTFHGVGPIIFKTDAKGELSDAGKRFAKWLDENPDRYWASMMNYAPDVPVGDKGVEQFLKYRDRYVGSIAGESLGYFYPSAEKMQAATKDAKTRRKVVEGFSKPSMEDNAAKYRKVYGKDLPGNPYAETIPCQSVEITAFAPISAMWGARNIGYESSAVTASMLGMKMAFLRGVSRQWDTMITTYRSCNFGDASTIFSKQSMYTTPQAILDNYYSVYSGAGMTWYKMDIWYQYMAGAGDFYHEQGFDEWWLPGGTAAAGIKEVQLSPKGKLVDRFLRVTAAEPDRGAPYTPVAILLDYAHGWIPAGNQPIAFDDWQQQGEKFRRNDHDQMLHEYFWAAYHPITNESEKPITSTGETMVPGVFGDIFDVIFAYPDTKRWAVIDTYPVVIAAGELDLTQAEGERLAKYVEDGGTLLLTDAQIIGPGISALKLPSVGATAEADSYTWLGKDANQLSQRFRYKPINAEGGRAIATAPNGGVFCAAFERGKGRLIYLSVPKGLGIDKQMIPAIPRLMAHLTRGVMPVQVHGDVEWLVNRTNDGWIVTLINPAGQLKPQQGINPTDYRENRAVTIEARMPIHSAQDRLLPEDKLKVDGNTVKLEVLAGSVRTIVIK